MRYVKNLIFLLILFSGPLAQAQLFRLEAGLGATQISWLESQSTADLNVQLSIQKKESKRKFFVALKAFGNLHRSAVDRSKYTFIEPRNTNSNPISSKNSNYIEEEKYRLHGINAGLGLIIPGKIVTTIQGQIFEPIMRDITLYGNYVGVPYTSTKFTNELCYKGKIGFKKAKVGALLTYEILNLGAAENKNSKSILATQANNLSFSLQYEF